MSEQIAKKKPFSPAETSAFCGQLALILKSGISALEGLQIMLDDATDSEEKAILQQILDSFSQTAELHRALDTTALFPGYMIQMVKLGEETGTLDDVMNALSVHYQREDDIKRVVKSSVTYPLIMAGMMIIVILVLLVKVMPIFSQVFVQLGTEMTGFSRVLLGIGSALNTNGIIIIAVLAVLAIVLLIMCRTSAGQSALRNIGRKLPYTKEIFEMTSACRFASGMALTLSSGLTRETALELCSSLNEDPVFAGKLETAKAQMEEGLDLSAALHNAGIFNGLQARMASIGEKTGSSEQVMEKIADLYQNEVDTRMNNMLSAIEPTLVIVLSLIVGVILLSVMLPLMGIMSSI